LQTVQEHPERQDGKGPEHEGRAADGRGRNQARVLTDDHVDAHDDRRSTEQHERRVQRLAAVYVRELAQHAEHADAEHREDGEEVPGQH